MHLPAVLAAFVIGCRSVQAQDATSAIVQCPEELNKQFRKHALLHTSLQISLMTRR